MNVVHKNNFFILAGTSGTGKTSVLQELNFLNYKCTEEAARLVLSEQLAIDGPALPSKDPMLFIQSMLHKHIFDFEKLQKEMQPCFFDRGLPDLIHYAVRFNVDTSAFKKASEKYRYNKKVFLFTPWQEIFINDNERRMTFEQSLEFHNILINAYEDVGYEFVEVPKLLPKERAEFILGNLS